MISLGDFCIEQGQDPRAALELMRIMNDKHVFNIARDQARLEQCSSNPLATRKPLEDEGDDWARPVWTMPASLFMQLYKQKNFGPEGFASTEGDKDILNRFPQCRIKTVSGKICGVGFGNKRTTIKKYE